MGFNNQACFRTKTTTTSDEIVWKNYVSCGVPESIAKFLTRGLRQKTKHGYSKTQQEWTEFSNQRGINPLSATVADLLEFFMELVTQDKFTFKKLQTARSSLRPLFDVCPDNILDTPILDCFVKAFFNVEPPKRRKLTTWSADQLLDYLETMRSPSQLAVHLLGAKLATLVLLATGCRLGELAVFHLDHLQVTPMGFNFQLPHFAKTCSPTNINSDLMRFYVCSTSMNPKLCPLLHLQEYIKHTEHLRTSCYLFMSSVEPFGKLSQQQLSKWVRSLLVAAGVQGSGKFQSVRSVVASALLTKGVPVDQILAKCHWKSAHAFYSNYHVQDPTLSPRAFRAAHLKLRTAMDNKVTPAI